MTARKRVISLISIITLILAITAGIALSAVVGMHDNTYVGESVTLSNTGVTINAQTSTKSDDTYPDDAVKIDTSQTLQDFINGSDTYGYLSADIELDWAGVGSQAYLASGRTIDGQGHTVTLSDAQATANVSNNMSDSASLSGSDGVVQGIQESGFNDGLDDPLDGGSNVAKRNYGLFVDFNMGTIKNIKFVYNQTSHSVANNSNAINKNYVGIVCGTNIGTISNCDLTVSGEFGFYYVSGSLSEDNFVENSRPKIGFATLFGGIAGRNAGKITNITAQYSDFVCNLNTVARNSKKVFWVDTDLDTTARTNAGGIAGTMYSSSAECSNIIVLTKDIVTSDGTKQVTFNLNAKRRKDGPSYREIAAVVPDNSAYSLAEGGIGNSANTQAKVDNIIVDFNPTIGGSGHTMGSAYSRNAVVYCGKSTNVTILNTTNKVVTINDVKQHIDYQTDHCNCGVAGNPGEHEAGYGNLINTGDYSDVTVGFDEDGKQVVTVTPKDKTNSMLGELTFTKYSNRGTTEDDSVLEAGVKDPENYADVAGNDTTYLYNKTEIRHDSYTFKIRPYQATSSKFWEIDAYSYQIATINNAGSAAYTYTGEDYLLNQLSYTTVADGKTGVVKPDGLNARTAGGEPVTVGKLPGEYNFTLMEKEAGLCYIDTENQVVVYVEDNPTQYSFKINLATVVPLDSNLLAENWIFIGQQDFTFELAGGLEGAADGYQYEVNGSQPTPVNGLVMQNRNDTRAEGRTYTVRLTCGGVVVTEPYTYTVKIDLTNPTAEIIHYEHPADKYYTHNKITIKAVDNASGVASIIMNSYGADESLTTYDIMKQGTLNADGTYTWQFKDTGRKEIVVTDNVGHVSTIEVNVKIDTTEPELTVDAYYYEEKRVEVGVNDDGSPKYEFQQIKTPYESGEEITSAVYFEATATFGESGGEVRYSLDDGATWNVYDGILTVKTPAAVKFRAVSNTYTHDEGEESPYPSTRPLVDNWDDKTMIVNIQLEKVVITLEDLVITGATKTFDGTDEFKGSVTVKEGYIADHGITGDVQITSVKYADVNSGEVALIIEVFCTDDTKIMDNQIEGAKGFIEKKSVKIIVEDKQKDYGLALPELTYKQEGMVEGFEESVELYVQKPEGYTGSYELLPQTANGEGYVITIVDGTSFDNYVLESVTEGRLRVNLATVDRLVYERGQFTGLDIDNIAERNLEIGFIRSNGRYEKLDVKFYAYEAQFDSATGAVIGGGYTREVHDITKAGPGFYEVVLSLPEFDAAGQPLTDKYVLKESITRFKIKIIDSSIFNKEEEPDKDEETQPSEDSSTVADKYENGTTDTDRTDIAVESSRAGKRDYVAMVSIFFAVAIVIAFAFGIGRVIFKRVKNK